MSPSQRGLGPTSLPGAAAAPGPPDWESPRERQRGHLYLTSATDLLRHLELPSGCRHCQGEKWEAVN